MTPGAVKRRSVTARRGQDSGESTLARVRYFISSPVNASTHHRANGRSDMGHGNLKCNQLHRNEYWPIHYLRYAICIRPRIKYTYIVVCTTYDDAVNDVRKYSQIVGMNFANFNLATFRYTNGG